MRMLLWAIAIAALVAVNARNAQAQMSMGTFHGYLTGHIGPVLGGDVSNPRISGGASVSVQETTGWGAEFDFGRATDVETESQRLGITTYMVNMAFIAPHTKIRPFAIAGAGISQIEGCICNHPAKTFDLGFSGGGGVFLLANDVIAVRADARYFWSGGDHADLGRPDHLTQWRISVGMTYLWAIAP